MMAEGKKSDVSGHFLVMKSIDEKHGYKSIPPLAVSFRVEKFHFSSSPLTLGLRLIQQTRHPHLLPLSHWPSPSPWHLLLIT